MTRSAWRGIAFAIIPSILAWIGIIAIIRALI